MRICNLQFAKGSIIYARFSGELDYLNGRPLVVVSDHIPVYDCVWVVKCGSRGRAGINICLWNYKAGDYMGGNAITTIYPYNIYTVKCSQILSTIGMLDRHVMKEVDKAIDFFMGRTDEVPEFLKHREQDLTGVTYQPAQDPYTRIDENVSEQFEYIGSKSIYPVQVAPGVNTWNRPLNAPTAPPVTMPPAPVTNFAPVPSKPIPVPEPVTPTQKPVTKSVPTKRQQRSGEISEDMIAEFLTLQCVVDPNMQSSAKELNDAYNAWASTTVAPVLFGRIMNSYISRTNPNITKTKVKGQSTYIGLGLASKKTEEDENPAPIEIPEPEVTIPEIDEDLFAPRETVEARRWASEDRVFLTADELVNPGRIMDAVGEESAIMIVGRKASIGAVQNKYCVNEDEAIVIRDTLQSACSSIGASLMMKIMKGSISDNSLNKFEGFCVTVASKLYGQTSAPKVRVRFNKLIQHTIRECNLDFDNREAWKGVTIYN